MISFYLWNPGNGWEDEGQHQGGLNKDEIKKRMPIITLSPYLIYLAAMCFYQTDFYMSTMLIMILYALFTWLCWCLLETGAIKEYYRFPYIQYCPVWLHYCTSTLVPGLLFPPLWTYMFGFFSCCKQKVVAAVLLCGSHCLEMHQSLTLGELHCLTLLECTESLTV